MTAARYRFHGVDALGLVQAGETARPPRDLVEECWMDGWERLTVRDTDGRECGEIVGARPDGYRWANALEAMA